MPRVSKKVLEQKCKMNKKKPESESNLNRKELIRLARKIARQEIAKALDQHLDDYEHSEKPLEEFEKSVEILRSKDQNSK